MLAQLFSFLLFITLIYLVISLIKPSIFRRFIKRDITRKQIAITGSIAFIVCFIIIGITAPKTTPVPDSVAEQNLAASDQTEQTDESQSALEVKTPEAEIEKAVNPTPVPKPATVTAPSTSITSAPQTTTISERDKMLAVFKADALVKWGNDYEMVSYEIKQQTEAYDWVVKNASYSSILAYAKQKWGNDYTMVKYEYGQQSDAYAWINQQTAYPDIMAQAKQKWGNDYMMVKYEYTKQVKAYEGL